jgi:hypothetical protein
MKTILLLFFPLFTFYAQTNDFPLKDEDFSKILLNEKLGFDGKIYDSKIDVKFETVSKDAKKSENYLVKGIYTLNGKTLTCSGQLTFNYVFNVKDHPNEMLVFGDFQLNGTQPDIDDGFFKGKFRIQTRKNLRDRGNYSTTTFKGIFTNLESGKESVVWFSNFSHDDISTVIFK